MTQQSPAMRGYFAIGVERISKPGNIGNLIRTAHGFGAAFVFAIRASYKGDALDEIARARSDTAQSAEALPYYEYDSVSELILPRGCRLVGIEITDDARDLPAFCHPLNAAYILGGERSGLAPDTLARCDHVVRIPTQFSLNLATAGAVVMYDRMTSRGRFPRRPAFPDAEPEPLPAHVAGGVRTRNNTGRGAS